MIKRSLDALRRLSPNCRQAADLISEATDRKLSPVDRLGLLLHLLICRACRAYRHSIRLLGDLMRTAAENPPASDGSGLSDAAKNRIAQKLRDP
jgi:hypothetical protein